VGLNCWSRSRAIADLLGEKKPLVDDERFSHTVYVRSFS